MSGQGDDGDAIAVLAGAQLASDIQPGAAGEEEIEDDVRRELEKELEKGLLAFYDVHIEESPQDTDLWYARALLLLDMGELPEAMRSIEYAARMDPASRKAMIVRSRVLSAMKETKQAAAGFRGTVAALVEEGQVRVRKAAEEEAKVTSKALEARADGSFS